MVGLRVETLLGLTVGIDGLFVCLPDGSVVGNVGEDPLNKEGSDDGPWEEKALGTPDGVSNCTVDAAEGRFDGWPIG